MCKCIKSFFKTFDLFSSPASLRVKGETEYQSVCAGFLSFLIFLGLIGIFATTFINILTKVNIEAKTEFKQNLEANENMSDFLFAIGIDGFNISSNYRYFTINFKHITI